MTSPFLRRLGAGSTVLGLAVSMCAAPAATASAATAPAATASAVTTSAATAPADVQNAPPQAAGPIETSAASTGQSAALPTRETVQNVAKVVRADPNLPGIRHIQSLRWKNSDVQQEEEPPPPDTHGWHWLRWLGQAIKAITRGARVLVWLLGAALVIWVLLRLRYWAKLRGAPLARGERSELPSYVGKLDIQPESLPDDIGSAVAALWRSGRYEQQRAALALLYRGALSRLVHGPAAVPIRATSTEGECLALARPRLRSETYDFLSGLVRIWQLGAYAARLPETAQVLALCEGFASQLPLTADAGKKGAA